jgi:L-aminopeptidase/D-esterase-like protein
MRRRLMPLTRRRRLISTLLLHALLLLLPAPPARTQTATRHGARPQPRTSFDGPAAEFDFPSLRVGVAEYDEGPTGVTVFLFPRGAKVAVDERGGSVASYNTHMLQRGYESRFVDAVSFAGGSSYGLEAAAGVSAELLASGAADTRWDGNIATVTGAIIYDFRGRYTSLYPDKELGRAAARAAQTGRFPLGARGAGRFAFQGKFFRENTPGGQGAAFRQIGPTKIAVFTVVNAMGAIVDRQGRVVRCTHEAASGYGASIAEHMLKATEVRRQSAANGRPTRPAAGEQPSRPAAGGPSVPTESTTLTLVVTNQKLSNWQLQRLAAQVHASMSRSIQPFQTVDDGDALFAASTDEVDNPELGTGALALHASELAWDAVLASVPAPDPPREGRAARLTHATLDAYAGRYEFRPGAVVAFTREGDRFFAQSVGAEAVYDFPKDSRVEIFPASETDFYLKNRWRHRLQFVRGAGGVAKLVLNPGHWGIPARKID